ncbi:MAG: LamG-like jellyroll fold domain-containing protein [Verrucomicrobiota bacterium]
MIRISSPFFGALILVFSAMFVTTGLQAEVIVKNDEGPTNALGLENAAVGGTARMTTVGWGGGPGRIHDGNPSGMWGEASVSHTNDATNVDGLMWVEDPEAPEVTDDQGTVHPAGLLKKVEWPDEPLTDRQFVEIELSVPMQIYEIVVYNRTDCCGERAADYRLSVRSGGDEAWGMEFPDAITENRSVLDDSGAALAFGQIVRLELNNGGIINLAEIEIYGEASADLDPVLVAPASTGLGQISGFPGVESGSYKIVNQGMNEDLVITGISIEDDPNGHFSLEEIAFPLTIAPGAEYVLNYQFDRMEAQGGFSASIVYASNDAWGQVDRSQISAAILNQNGPIAYYALDEADASTGAFDSSGFGRAGTFADNGGSFDFGAEGLSSETGTSIGFAGGAQVAAPASALPVLDSFTVSMWANLEAAAGLQTLAGLGTDQPAWVLVAWDQNLALFIGDGNEPDYVTDSNPLTGGTSHHVAMAYHGGVGETVLTVYVDGAVVLEEDLSAEPLNLDGGGNLAFGSFLGQLPLSGRLDEVQFYNRAITAENVSFLKDNPGQTLGSGSVIDSDGDGLTDEQEVTETQTNPLSADSDNDGLADPVETNTGVYVSDADTGTDPNLADSDGDGYSDPSELAFNSDPSDAASTPLNDPNASPLLVCWDFNDATNETQSEGFGGIVGTLEGEASFTPDGGGHSGEAGDRALDLGDSGDNSHLLVESDILSVTGQTDQITVAFWQKLDSVTNMTSFKGRSPSSNGGERGMSVHTPWGNSIIYYDTAGCCNASQRINRAASIDFLEWHHFAFTKNGPRKEIWIDGELFHEGNNDGPLPDDFEDFTIGAAIGGSESLDGVMDDFAVFGLALNEEAIGKLAAGQSPKASLGFEDADSDGLDDFWEERFFGDLTSQTGEGDADGDGLTNQAEHDQADSRFDPTNPDVDGDTLTDGEEIALGTDPFSADTDRDGVSDGDEAAGPTDPLEADTDGDGFGDGSELAQGFDPVDSDSCPVCDGWAFGPIEPRLELGKLESFEQLHTSGLFTHGINIGGPEYRVGNIVFAADDPAPGNIEWSAVNHLPEWRARNEFGEGPDNEALENVAHSIRWSGQPDSVTVTLKGVFRGAYRLQMIFGEKCCDRGFDVMINGEIIEVGGVSGDNFSPNVLQEGDYSGASAAYLIYEFNQEEEGDLLIDLNGVDTEFPDKNPILSGVSLELVQRLDAPFTGEIAAAGDQTSPLVFGGVIDGWNSIMVIDETRPFDFGEASEGALRDFNFIVGAARGRITPFVVEPTGEPNSFIVRAIGTTRVGGADYTEADVNLPVSFAFDQLDSNLIVQNGWLAGFTVAAPDGSNNGGSVVPFSAGGGEMWLVGGPGSDNSGSVVIGEAPGQDAGDLQFAENSLDRLYHFQITAQGPGSPPAADPSPHLVGYWSANDAAGEVVSNAVNAGLNGVLNGGTWTADGGGHTGAPGDYAFELSGEDGGGSHVVVPPTGLTFSEITITGWVKGVHTGDWSGLIQARGGAAPDQPIGIGFSGGSGNLAYTWNDNANTSWGFESNLAIAPDEWTFVALSLTAEAATLYVGNDGVLNSAVNGIPQLAQMNENTSWFFGKDNCCGTARNFDGLMDDISIWNVALTEEELTQLLTMEATPLEIRSGEPVETPDPAAITEIVRTAEGGLAITFTGEAASYDLEFSETLEPGSWEVVTSSVDGGETVTVEDTDPVRTSLVKGFYRLVEK